MARKPRVKAKSGVYHVLMQGVRHRDVFQDEEDYLQFVDIIQRSKFRNEEDVEPCFTLYGYCLMADHLHLLIKEGAENISTAVSRIATMYSHYFNNKYDRDGAVYRGRFASDPVEDSERMDYVMRYIHQTPVRLEQITTIGEYRWSSWKEYATGEMTICQVPEVYKGLEKEERLSRMMTALPKGVKCLAPRKAPKPRPSDGQVMVYLHQITGVTTIHEFVSRPHDECLKTLTDLRRRGASVRQLVRLTGIGRGIIQRL